MKNPATCTMFLQQAAPLLLQAFKDWIFNRSLGEAPAAFPINESSWSEKDGAYIFSKTVGDLSGPGTKITVTWRVEP